MVTPLCMIFFVDGSYLLIGPMGIAGFLALIFVNLAFYKSYKKQVLNKEASYPFSKVEQKLDI